MIQKRTSLPHADDATCGNTHRHRRNFAEGKSAEQGNQFDFTGRTTQNGAARCGWVDLDGPGGSHFLTQRSWTRSEGICSAE